MKKDLYSQLKKLPYIDTSISFFSAHEQYVPHGWEAYQSSHSAFEILLIISGKQESIINQKSYIVEKNDVLLIPPGTLHTNRCMSKEGMTYFTAHFDIDDPAFRYTLMKNGKLIYRNNTENNLIIRNILNDWIQLYEQETVYTLSDRLLTLEILTRLMTAIIKFSEENIDNQFDIQYLSIARNIAEIIQHNFNAYFLYENRDKNQLLLKNIYREANISMSYGLEVFRKIYGISPKEYLDQLKLKEAKRLIKNPDIAIELISESVGYSSVSHFSRQFKKWTGVSPRVYRQRESHFQKK